MKGGEAGCVGERKGAVAPRDRRSVLPSQLDLAGAAGEVGQDPAAAWGAGAEAGASARA